VLEGVYANGLRDVGSGSDGAMVTAYDSGVNVECEQHHAGLAVSDVPAAVDFYTTKLGFRIGFTWGEPVTFAGLDLDRVQIFLQQGTPSPGGSTVYFRVGDADELYEFHRRNGVDVAAPIDDREYGLRDYTIRDAAGYLLTFGHSIFNSGPKVEIERVDVPLRLEKRLAALLEDLAKHKRMSLSSCVEEILLHTNDDAGPHTKRQLAYIQELKKKHGIDYDSHASYGWVEKGG
jgi:catechol 2,3-dioxygenase-like lactoylglutathione lyase family enzyme